MKRFLPFLLLLISAFFLIPGVVSAQDTGKTVPKEKPKGGGKVLTGVASFYSDSFNGRRTANGEIFSQQKMTCACNQLPMGTWVRVTNNRNGRSVVVKVNDRMHPRMKRVVDLTRAAASQLGFIKAGLTRVKVEVLGRKKPE